MAYSPSTIANYFLEKAQQSGVSLTPMQVIKLTYIAHGWHLGYFNSSLINEPVEAWPYGPVIDSLYHGLKKYGGSPVQSFLSAPVSDEVEIKNNQNTRALLDHVWSRYSNYSGPQLSTLTHQPGTPWSEVWAKKSPFSRSDTIPDAAIQRHYKAKIDTAQ